MPFNSYNEIILIIWQPPVHSHPLVHISLSFSTSVERLQVPARCWTFTSWANSGFYLCITNKHSHLASRVCSSWQDADVDSSQRRLSLSLLHHLALNLPTCHLGQCERSAQKDALHNLLKTNLGVHHTLSRQPYGKLLCSMRSPVFPLYIENRV